MNKFLILGSFIIIAIGLISSTLVASIPFGSATTDQNLSNGTSRERTQPDSEVRGIDRSNLEEKEPVTEQSDQNSPNKPSVRDPNKKPKANAGPDLVVNVGDKVILDGGRSDDPDKDKLQFAWIQVSPKVPRIELINSDSKISSFVAPEVSKPTVFSFILNLNDGNEGTSKDLVKIKVTKPQLTQADNKDQDDTERDKPVTPKENRRKTMESASSSDNQTILTEEALKAAQQSKAFRDSAEHRSANPSSQSTSVRQLATSELTPPSSDGEGGISLAIDFSGHRDHVCTIVIEPFVTEEHVCRISTTGKYTWNSDLKRDVNDGSIGLRYFSTTGSATCHTTRQWSDETAGRSDPVQSQDYSSALGEESIVLYVGDNSAGMTAHPIGGPLQCAVFDIDEVPIERTSNGVVTGSGAISQDCSSETPIPPEIEVVCSSVSSYSFIVNPCESTAGLQSSTTGIPQFKAAADQCSNLLEANAGPDQIVNERRDVTSRTTVQLAGSSNVPPLTFHWTGESGAPPLNNPNIANPTFNIPDISEDTDYTYTLTVSNGISTSSDSVVIHVIATKIKLELEAEEILPKIAGLGFGHIVHFPGDNLANHYKQPEIAGGELEVRAQIEGITNRGQIPIRFSFEPLLDTGGHDHLNAVDDPAKNAFGGFVDGRGVVLQVDQPTNAGGLSIKKFKVENLNDKKASSAGGFIDIKVSTIQSNFETLKDTEKLTIRVSGLAALLDGTNYDLVGATPGLHPDNHYGRADVVAALPDIADRYHTHHKHTTQTLRFNDMSLVFGGVFDAYNPNPTPPKKPTIWLNPHLAHACGTDLDVGVRSVQNHPNGAQDIDFEDFAESVSHVFPGAFVIEENHKKDNWHLHVHFANCQ